MESNYKKLNQRSNTNNTTFRNRFMRTQYDNKEKGNKHIFLKKMLKTKESTGSQKEMNLTEQNYRKVFKNVENLFTNDNAKKKAMNNKKIKVDVVRAEVCKIIIKTIKQKHASVKDINPPT